MKKAENNRFDFPPELARWFWNDNNNWNAYSQDQSILIEKKYLENSKEEISFGNYSVNLDSLFQKNIKTGFSREIRRGTWFWENNGKLVPFDEKKSLQMENCFAHVGKKKKKNHLFYYFLIHFFQKKNKESFELDENTILVFGKEDILEVDKNDPKNTKKVFRGFFEMAKNEEEDLQFFAVNPISNCPHLELFKPLLDEIDVLHSQCNDCKDQKENWICKIKQKQNNKIRK